MSFYKDTGGFLLFILCLINFILQFYFLYVITSKDNIICLIHKIANYIFFFLTVYSYFKTTFTDPGEITINNNKEMIEFYYQVHEPLIKQALHIIKKKTPEVVKKIILGDNPPPNEEENNDNDSVNSDKDEYEFEPKTSINDGLKKIIEEKYKMKVTRCINCYVVRPINAHHCNVCHKCYINQDHHCPWVNNCIALFNKKFFLLFLFYGIIEILYLFFLFFYYSLYKNRKNLNFEVYDIIIFVFSMVFGLIQLIVSIMLLWDQYDTIVSDCTECDFKRGILWEKSTIKQQFQIIFGGIFNYKWLLPFFSGGNSEYYKQFCHFLKIREQMKRMENNNNEIKNESKEKHE